MQNGDTRQVPPSLPRHQAVPLLQQDCRTSDEPAGGQSLLLYLYPAAGEPVVPPTGGEAAAPVALLHLREHTVTLVLSLTYYINHQESTSIILKMKPN